MLDLEAIKKRHLDLERNRGRTYYEGHIEVDLAALVAEVEHLRVEVEAANAEAATMRSWAEQAAKAENEHAEDARRERAAVVAWLREQRQYGTDELIGQGFATVCGILSDCIERGEHRRKEAR